MNPPDPAVPPAFVVGPGRSGTTMLRLMLDAHPRLAIPPESHFVPAVWRVRRRYQRPGGVDAARLARDIVGTFRFREWGLPAEEVLDRVRALDRPTVADVVEAAFLAYAAHHGKDRWGDKTPSYGLDLPLIAGMFPEARFVHLVRDGRDVALSLRDVPWGTSDPVQAAEFWSHRVRVARRDGTALGPGRFLELRYEDLVADPEGVLGRVCGFLDLDLRPEMLRYFERSGRALPERVRRSHEHEGKPPTAGLRDWRREMDPVDVALFEAVAGEELEALGYERSTPRPSAGIRLRAGVRRVRTGLSRAAWRARFRAVLLLRRDRFPPSRRW
ncbi:MAG: sulfotransferase [Actinobacteria bacterium]|nr:sulfotransferase [Actinomycetota bacterium]